MMEQLTKIVSEINGFLWGMYCLIPVCAGIKSAALRMGTDHQRGGGFAVGGVAVPGHDG